MAQDLVKSGVELPALTTAGRWKSAKMPARYTERQAADRGAVVRYYGEKRYLNSNNKWQGPAKSNCEQWKNDQCSYNKRRNSRGNSLL